jgi:hypothetical protein
VKSFARLMLATLASLTLAGCLGTTYPTTDATDPNGNIYTSPGGKVVQEPPVNMRQGNSVGENGGSGGRN